MVSHARELEFVWEGISIPIKIESNSRGFYAIVDNPKWELVHVDDLCNSTLAVIEFLFENNLELSGEWGGYVDSNRTPVFWLKDS